jgi:chemotaxis protein CheX
VLPPEELVVELTQMVWSTMLGRETEQTGTSAPPAITTAVDIHGAWEGTIAMSFPKDLARRLATALDEEAEPPSESEVTDALCEIVNMVGGNLKAVLPGPSQLSPPRVAEPDDATCTGRTQWFTCDGMSFGVTVNEVGRRVAT